MNITSKVIPVWVSQSTPFRVLNQVNLLILVELVVVTMQHQTVYKVYVVLIIYINTSGLYAHANVLRHLLVVLILTY